jgi:hypothetical protein
MPKGLSAVGAKFKEGQKGKSGIKELSIFLDEDGLPILDPKKREGVEPFIMRFMAPAFAILEPNWDTLREAAKNVPSFATLIEHEPENAFKVWQIASCYLPDAGEEEVSALVTFCQWHNDPEMAPLMAYVIQGFRGLFPGAFNLAFAVGEAKND